MSERYNQSMRTAARPSATFMERVRLPVRAPSSPESGLDSILGVLAPTLLSMVTGIHGLGETLDTTAQISATRAEQAPALPKEKPQNADASKGPQSPQLAQNAPTPSLTLTAPLEMTLIDVPVRRDFDPLDPRLRATDPGLADQYRPRPSSLAEAALRLAKPTADSSSEVKESVPWRMRR
jgi:hypothetical protein